MGESLTTVERARSGFAYKFILALAMLFAIYELFVVMGFNFILYTIFEKLGVRIAPLLFAPDLQQSMAFLMGILLLSTYIIKPLRKNDGTKIPIYDYALGVLAFISFFYLVITYPEIIRLGYVELTIDRIVMPIISIILLFEAARRSLGAALPIIASVILMLGFYYEGFNLRLLLNHMYYSREGIFSIPLFVMTSYVFAFIFFGAILEKMDVGKYITELILSAVGRRSGGPAKTAVLASALLGTISGSSVANVLTTGTFTIPLMKRAGYPPEVAGAVEPAASTGGQLMPPIMGAAAFVMAEFLGRPYREIIIAAVIPAIAYFASIYLFVDRATKKLGIKPLMEEKLPTFKELINRLYLLAPIPLITYLLLAGLEPQYAVAGSLGAAIIAAWFAKPHVTLSSKIVYMSVVIASALFAYFLGISISASLYFSGVLSLILAIIVGLILKGGKELTINVINAFNSALRTSASVFLAGSIAGMIQGVLTMTGWATLIGYRLIDIVGGNIFLLMLSVMVISLILGMGVPTTANYIITTTISGVALGTAIADWSGLPFKSALLVAHMFVFYFGILADLTPPVALATYAGSALAKSNFWKTAFNASTYALAGYLVPYIFATNPSLLIITVRYWDFTAVASLVTGIAVIVLTMLFLSSGIVGWLGGQLNRVNQIAITLAGVLIYVLTVVLKSESTLVIAVATLVYLAIYMVNLRRFKQQM
ncbi:MAG: TRAP transporter fused permease subunit [Sulfolobales archaeon]|nr:TRAP transporter fused permease subunit [Sulfolobales archaeon]